MGTTCGPVATFGPVDRSVGAVNQPLVSCRQPMPPCSQTGTPFSLPVTLCSAPRVSSTNGWLPLANLRFLSAKVIIIFWLCVAWGADRLMMSLFAAHLLCLRTRSMSRSFRRTRFDSRNGYATLRTRPDGFSENGSGVRYRNRPAWCRLTFPS